MFLNRSDCPYEKWAETEGIPIVRGYSANAYEITLEPWKRTGGLGALIILEGGEGFSSAHVGEIPPGKSLKPQKHLYEERVYILQGKGQTTVWNDGGGPTQTFSWQENSLFSPPLNTWYQHANTGDQPAKYMAVTNAPLIFDIYRNPDFIFNTNFAFKDRYNYEPDYFDGKGRMVDDVTWEGGFIPDVRSPHLSSNTHYGKGFGIVEVVMSANSMEAHLAQVEAGNYKKPHRHAGGAHILISEGTGFAVMWEGDKKVKADFKKGSIYSPPEGWFHTHCNTGTQPVRQVALRSGIPGIGKIYKQRVPIKQGGDLLEREDEPPWLRELVEEELKKKE